MSLPASDWLPLLTAYEAKLVSIISTCHAAAFFIQSLGSSMSPSQESTHIIPFFNDTISSSLAHTTSILSTAIEENVQRASPLSASLDCSQPCLDKSSSLYTSPQAKPQHNPTPPRCKMKPPHPTPRPPTPKSTTHPFPPSNPPPSLSSTAS